MRQGRPADEQEDIRFMFPGVWVLFDYHVILLVRRVSVAYNDWV